MGMVSNDKPLLELTLKTLLRSPEGKSNLMAHNNEFGAEMTIMLSEAVASAGRCWSSFGTVHSELSGPSCSWRTYLCSPQQKWPTVVLTLNWLPTLRKISVLSAKGNLCKTAGQVTFYSLNGVRTCRLIPQLVYCFGPALLTVRAKMQRIPVLKGLSSLKI